MICSEFLQKHRSFEFVAVFTVLAMTVDTVNTKAFQNTLMGVITAILVKLHQGVHQGVTKLPLGCFTTLCRCKNSNPFGGRVPGLMYYKQGIILLCYDSISIIKLLVRPDYGIKDMHL